MKTNSVLLTGATGLLGSYLVPLLCNSGIIVYSASRQSKFPFHHINFKNIDLDLLDLDDTYLPSFSFDAIIHLAQSRNYPFFPDESQDVFSINTKATLSLLLLAKRCKSSKFIYASTGSVYSASAFPLHEDSLVKTSSQCDFYSASKLSAELLLSQFSDLIDITVFRPFFVYGKSTVRSMLIPRLYDSVLHHKEISLQGQNGLLFNPIHAYDASISISQSLASESSGIFNLAGPEIISLRSVCESFGQYIGHSPTFKSISSSPPSVIADITKLSAHLHSPTLSLQNQISDIAA